MDTDQITQEIERIIEALDMGAKGCAKAMGISVQAFRNKKSQGSHRDKFNEKNLQDLIRYIKEVSSQLPEVSSQLSEVSSQLSEVSD